MAYTGQILDGKYRIIRELGRGGMSIVYLAVDVRLNKKWAVKEVRRYTDGFMAEADVIKNFDHPVLPRIVDVISEDESAFIVMDYIEGRSLSEVLRCDGPQSPETVVRWAESLCDALIYLHSMDTPVVYRDMKPSNIMLKPDGSVRVIDFGAAVRLDDRRVSDGISFGTMGYAAPEQLDGGESVDVRSDIYSLGATIYTLLTGDVPKHPDQMKGLVDNSKIQIPEMLGKVIVKCLSYYPEDRYENCEELKYQLHKCGKSSMARRTDNRKKLLLYMAAALTMGCILFYAVNGYAGSGGNNRRNADADNGRAEMFMEMGIDFFERFKDYKKSAQYFEMAENAGIKDAGMYREISLALSRLDVDYDSLAVMLSEFEGMTDMLSDSKRKLDNYKLLGDVYTEYGAYIKDSESELIEIGDKGIHTLGNRGRADSETNNYYISFYQYAALGCERLGDIIKSYNASATQEDTVQNETGGVIQSTSNNITEAEKYYSRALENVEYILNLTKMDEEIVVGDMKVRDFRKTKLIRKAELLIKLSMFDEACRVYEEAEEEYGDEGGEFYIGHLSLLCEVEEGKTMDVEQWDYEKLLGLYERGKTISGITDDYRWKRLQVKLKPLLERTDKGG